MGLGAQIWFWQCSASSLAPAAMLVRRSPAVVLLCFSGCVVAGRPCLGRAWCGDAGGRSGWLWQGPGHSSPATAASSGRVREVLPLLPLPGARSPNSIARTLAAILAGQLLVGSCGGSGLVVLRRGFQAVWCRGTATWLSAASAARAARLWPWVGGGGSRSKLAGLGFGLHLGALGSGGPDVTGPC